MIANASYSILKNFWIPIFHDFYSIDPWQDPRLKPSSNGKLMIDWFGGFTYLRQNPTGVITQFQSWFLRQRGAEMTNLHHSIRLTFSCPCASSKIKIVCIQGSFVSPNISNGWCKQFLVARHKQHHWPAAPCLAEQENTTSPSLDKYKQYSKKHTEVFPPPVGIVKTQWVLNQDIIPYRIKWLIFGSCRINIFLNSRL